MRTEEAGRNPPPASIWSKVSLYADAKWALLAIAFLKTLQALRFGRRLSPAPNLP